MSECSLTPKTKHQHNLTLKLITIQTNKSYALSFRLAVRVPVTPKKKNELYNLHVQFKNRLLTLCTSAVAKAAALTNALLLDNPAAGGITPLTTTENPCKAVFSGKTSKIPLIPHRKYWCHCGFLSVLLIL